MSANQINAVFRVHFDNQIVKDTNPLIIGSSLVFNGYGRSRKPSRHNCGLSYPPGSLRSELDKAVRTVVNVVAPYLNVYRLGNGFNMNITFSDKDDHEDNTRLGLAKFIANEFKYLLHIRLNSCTSPLPYDREPRDD